MSTKIVLPKSYCEDEVVVYLANRHRTTPLDVITQFLRGEGILSDSDTAEYAKPIHLADNEIAICRDLGIAPSQIEVIE